MVCAWCSRMPVILDNGFLEVYDGITGSQCLGSGVSYSAAFFELRRRVSWGLLNTPIEDRINPDMDYTCDGKRVINLIVELYNSIGQEVTFPVKGNVVLKERPFKSEYRIWTLDGRAEVVKGSDRYDLKLVTSGRVIS